MWRSSGKLLFAIAIAACGGQASNDTPATHVDGGARPAPVQVPPGDASAAGVSDAQSGGVTTSDAAARTGLLVGYYADWASSTLPLSAIDWSSITHVAQAFALPRTGGGLTNAGTFPNPLLVQTAHTNGVRVIVSVGGASVDFAKAAGDATSRAATVTALAALCSQSGYDGIDVDWEFPDSSTVSAWVALIDELRAALDAVRPGLSISATIGPSYPDSDILPVASIAKLSWLSAMTYRYTNPTDAVVGPYAPLVAPAGAEDGSVTQSIRHLVQDRGIPAAKILLGLGFYGEQFVDGPPGTVISGPATVTVIDQQGIVPLIGSTGWTLSWDSMASESSLLNGKTWITYEDSASIDAKCAFVHEAGLGGAMIWHMASGVLADGSQPLIGHASGCR